MPYYRLYCINSAGNVFCSEDFDAGSDAHAIAKAEELRGSHAGELWQQGRMVHFFDSRDSG